MPAPAAPAPPPIPAGRRPARWVNWLAAALLAAHFALAVGSKLHESTTSDELVHLTAGVSYWANNDYRLHPENGILPQRWAALPAWLAGARLPDLAGNPYWQTSDVWGFGYQFFYETGADHFPRLMAGRAMIALFSVATGVLVFGWSRRLFGDTGALVSLGFFAFSPDFLAHGALVTSDVCMAFFFLASVGAWWRHLHDDRFRYWLLSAGTLGLAFTAKHSAVLLPIMMIAMAAVRAAAPEPWRFADRNFTTRGGKFGAAALSALGHAAVVILILSAFYGFRYSAFNPALPPADHFIRPWAYMESHSGAAGSVIHFLAATHLLPESWLYGLAYVLATGSFRSAFLNGEYSLTGWPTFFLWTFLLKSTLATLAAALLLFAGGVSRWAGWRQARRTLYRFTPLLVLFTVYWTISLSAHLNIGHRHILPTYPALFIGFGALALPGRGIRRGWQLAILGGLVGWQALAAGRSAPHFLAYFNPLGGGPANGWRHLVDSSLDWGQDLPGLKRWLDRHPSDQPVYLSYFGTGDPGYYHLDVRRLPFTNNFHIPPAYVKLEAGTYCVSATMLSQVYSPIRGAIWTLQWETEYQELRAIEPMLARYTLQPEQRPALEREAPRARWLQTIGRFEALRFARLCHYLRVKTPEANVGHSIFIYRLTAEEIDAATAGSLSDWRALLERAVAVKS